MLDVAIGFTLIFLLISLICTAISELIESIIRRRASDLFSGIKELLQDKDGKGLTAKIYNHPLIYSLYKGGYVDGFKKNLPSYIPSRSFALALLDILSPDTIHKDTPAPTMWDADTENVRKALLTLTSVTNNDVEASIKSIENWYNGTMDRVSGWYKRRVQRILIAIGFCVAIIMNADTLAIFKSLSSDSELRNSLVAVAQEYAKSTDTVNGKAESPEERIESNNKKLRELRLPIGWDWSRPSELSHDKDFVTNYTLAVPLSFWGWVLKFAGWIITGLAVSLGASFWFDTLNKVMVIRSTVKPTEKSKDESSEDRQN